MSVMAPEYDHLYGQPSEPIDPARYLAGLLEGTIQLGEVPPSITVEGKMYLLNPANVLRGIRLGVSNTTHGQSFLTYRAQEAAQRGCTFSGLYVEEPMHHGGNEQLVFAWTNENPEEMERGSYIEPSVIEPEVVQDFIRRAVPKTAKDYRFYIRDILLNFCNRPKVQTLYANEMDIRYVDNESWSVDTTELVERVEELDAKNKRKMGDNYSRNASIRRIAKKLMREVHASSDPDLEAHRFATSWLELRFEHEIAVRTQQRY